MGINSTEVAYGFGQMGSVFTNLAKPVYPPKGHVIVAIQFLADTTPSQLHTETLDTMGPQFITTEGTEATDANYIGVTEAAASGAGSSVAYNTSSDYRLKENVVAISDGITRLKTLKPSRFNFKSDSSITLDGFLAHEVTAVPEAITGTKDEVDSDNNPVYQGIDQSKLVPLLTAALQEAVTKIETLETKVAALEGS